MQDCLKTIAFVVATKDRPDDLRKMLRSLWEQSHRPDQIVIVDSSATSVIAVTKEFPELNIKYIHHTPPSASAQRNRGIRAVGPDMSLIGFLDDDIVLAKNALEIMLKFWQFAPNDLGGCAFNLMNPPSRSASGLKESALSRCLGLYSDKKGIVMPSGWQTLTETVKDTTFVEWLPSTAAVWRRDVFDGFSFEEFFEGYSYLEDLDFSYGVSKHYRLAIVADAKFWHYPSPSGRVSQYRFGIIEVRNRLYIVRKHQLSLPKCYFGIMIRLFMTIGSAVKTRNMDGLRRALGNCQSIVQIFFQNEKIPGVIR
jgi:GT2 family glycosyltransferase